MSDQAEVEQGLRIKNQPRGCRAAGCRKNNCHLHSGAVFGTHPTSPTCTSLNPFHHVVSLIHHYFLRRELNETSKHILNAQASIRAPCCQKWFDCPECHAETADHNLRKTTEMVFMCKKCRKAFRKDVGEFEESDEYCPHCDNHFVSNRP